MSVKQIDLLVFLVHGFHSDSVAMNDFATAGGKVRWDKIGGCNRWRLQQNKLSQHLRILHEIKRNKYYSGA